MRVHSSINERSKKRSFRKIINDYFKESFIFTWKESLYEYVWIAMLVWVMLWFAYDFFAKFIMTQDKNGYAYKYLLQFNEAVNEIQSSVQMLSVFCLGFYVNILYQRWWALYFSIPWPDDTAMLLNIAFTDEFKELKTTLVRFALVSQALVFAFVSNNFEAFLQDNPLVEQKFLHAKVLSFEEELRLKRCIITCNDCTYWTPYMWMQQIILQHYEAGHIKSELLFHKLMETINKYNNGLGSLLTIKDCIIPISYIQVVTLLVWANYIIGIFCSHNFIHLHNTESNKAMHMHNVYHYLPFPFIRFFIILVLLGWQKGSESLLNPLKSSSETGSFDLKGMYIRNKRITEIMIQCPTSPFFELTEKEFDSVKNTVYVKTRSNKKTLKSQRSTLEDIFSQKSEEKELSKDQKELKIIPVKALGWFDTFWGQNQITTGHVHQNDLSALEIDDIMSDESAKKGI